ncbi:hypothetical protein BH11ACT3_BH11ACT3_01260 [soil metagenome]
MNLRLGALLRRHLRSASATSLLIAILVAATVFVIAAAPRALVQLGTRELRYELQQQPTALLDLSGNGPLSYSTSSSTASIDEYLGPVRNFVQKLPSRIPSPLSDGVGDSAWVVRTTALTESFVETPTTKLVIKLAVDLAWADRITVVDGALPTRWDPPVGDAAPAPIGVAIDADTAEAMKLQVGDQLLGDSGSYLISAIYQPTDPDDDYWTHARDLDEPALIRESGNPFTIQASVFVAPETLIGLQDAFAAGEFSAWVAIDPTAYEFADLPVLRAQVRNVTATPFELPTGGQLSLRSTLDDVFESTQAKVSATSALVALTGSGFLGVLIATYALCIQALISRRRTALALGSARGASAGQLRLVMSLEAALVSLPGSAVAVALAAVLVPADVGWDGWVGPAVVALLPVLLAVVLTDAQADRESGRDDLGARSSGSARWVAEIAVVALAALALFLLQRRGLVASSAAVGIDPLLAATPLLLAAVVGLAVLRLYHLPLRAVHRALRRREAAASVVGSARAIRDPAIGLVATLALVAGISIVVFTTGMISTVAEGLRQSARDQVGADMRIAAHDLPASLIADLDALPEIATAVALVSKSGTEFSDESSPSEVTVVLADTRALHAVRSDIPDISGKVDGRLQILISSDWARTVDGTDLSVVNSSATAVGVVPVDALPGVSRRWILVDSAAKDELDLASLTPDLVLARISESVSSADAVSAVTETVKEAQPDEFVDGVRVDDAQSLLHTLRAAPVVAGLERSLLIAAGAALALTMLIVVLSALAAAATRNRVVGVLRILGMSPPQIRRIVAWEFAPVTIAAVVIGAALGIGLPYLVTSVLDLRGFVGGNAPPQPSIEPTWVALAIGIFVGGVVLSAIGATLAGRRFAPAGTLKMGEE